MKTYLNKVTAFLIACLMLGAFAGCGSARADAQYEGKWISVAGEALGITVSGEDISGFGFEFQSGGKATVTIDGESHSAKWSNDDTNITVNMGGTELVGTIGDNTIRFNDMMGTGMDITFAKEGTDAANPELYLPENDKKMIGKWVSYNVTDVLGDPTDEVAANALEMEFTADHMVKITCAGADLGNQEWSLLGTFGSLDNTDLSISWNIKDDELEVDYSVGDDYFTFLCKKQA